MLNSRRLARRLWPSRSPSSRQPLGRASNDAGQTQTSMATTPRYWAVRSVASSGTSSPRASLNPSRSRPPTSSTGRPSQQGTNASSSWPLSCRLAVSTAPSHHNHMPHQHHSSQARPPGCAALPCSTASAHESAPRPPSGAHPPSRTSPRKQPPFSKLLAQQ